MSNERYFVDSDDDGHYYVVPQSRKSDWEIWANLDRDDERSWEEPDFVRRVDGGSSAITFSNPHDYEGNEIFPSREGDAGA